MIVAENLCLKYSNETALENISFELKKGESAAIVGASGCGKTSLLYLLADLLKPDSGIVSVDRNLLPAGVLFQQDLLLPWKNILKNVLLGLVHSEENKLRAVSLLENYSICDQKNKFPFQLSGGQRQRAALARTLIRDPRLLLLDEPTASLDEITREKLQNDLKQTVQNLGLTMVFVTHNIEEAVYLGSKILIMKQKDILCAVDNPAYNLQNSRKQQLFFDTCCSVRSFLEQAKAYG